MKPANGYENVDLAEYIIGALVRYQLGVMSENSKERIYGKIPKQYLPLLMSMLSINPDDRPTTEQILQQLNYNCVQPKTFFSTEKFSYSDEKLKNRNEMERFIIHLVEFYKMKQTLIPVSMDIFDRYYSKNDIRKYHCLALASLCLAIDILLGQITILSISDKLTNNTCSIEEIKQMKCDIIKFLDFKLYKPL